MYILCGEVGGGVTSVRVCRGRGGMGGGEGGAGDGDGAAGSRVLRGRSSGEIKGLERLCMCERAWVHVCVCERESE